MEPQTVGVLEVRRTPSGRADIRMPFAYELVAGAMIRIRPDEKPLEEFIRDAFVTLTETAAAATSAIQVLAQFYLLDRFR